MIGKDEQRVASSGSGWKPALLVTVGKCDSICQRIKDSIPSDESETNQDLSLDPFSQLVGNLLVNLWKFR